jgi:hypothetical protein
MRRLAKTNKQFVDMPSPIAPAVPNNINIISTPSAYLKIMAIEILSFLLIPPFSGEAISPFKT